ncbi:pyrroloquinoline quinone biosynthesis protein PqqE [Terrihabitans sp. B22-R8]|uniref:pyrroloquinoline quinone biosynthesis protein PqqE n=1 Tax=Terrihabitans sp. B22-R8 TaxID=3425128 RepID=UPI00403C89A1
MTAHVVPPPVGMLAELTHRCPLGCPYCSNPIEMERKDLELDTETWKRLFSEAAALGVLHVHLSGGEPMARRDIIDLVRHCAEEGLYTNLITSGIGMTEARLGELKAAGLDHVQLSIQGADSETADRIAGYRGAFARKREVASWVNAAGLPLTVNAVIHRANVHRAADMVRLAMELGARRVEIAHTQYYGWALRNRDALMPSKEDARAAVAEIERLKVDLAGRIAIDHVIPDYYAKYPKACMGGWARKTFNVTPSGKVLPCHASETIPGLEFWSGRDRSLGEIWTHSPAFNAFRGTDWMQEPCRSCPRQNVDFGGCRCQALALVGDAAATDPACTLSPHHHVMEDLTREIAAPMGEPVYEYRRLA